MSEPLSPSTSPLFDTNTTHTSSPSGSQLSDGFVLNEVPTSSVFNYMFNTFGAWITWLSTKLALFPGYAADSALTIASNSVTPTAGNHSIVAGTTMSTSSLSLISTANLGDGRLLIISWSSTSTGPLVLTNAAGSPGQIHLNDGLNYTLNSVGSFVTLKRVGNDWYEVSRSLQVTPEVPGVIKAYGGTASSIPAGYFLCDGSPVSRTQYSSLYSAIGTNFGQGDGTSTFNVPNLMGRFLRGQATYPTSICTAVNSGTSVATFSGGHPYKQSGVKVRLTSGTISGLSSHTDYFVIYVDANNIAFASSLANAVSGSPTKVSITATSSGVISQWEDPDALARVNSTVGSNSAQSIGSLQTDDMRSHAHSLPFNNNGHGGTSGSDTPQFPSGSTTGASGNNETRPLNIGVNYIIKY
jgi:microcystin-dependent protein